MTRGGRSLLIGSILVIIGGRLLGLAELVAIGVCGPVLLIGAWVTRVLTPSLLTVERRVTPSQVSVGERIVVHLSVRNGGRRRSHAVGLVDPISRSADSSPAPRAVVAIDALRPGSVIDAAYAMDTPRRGLITVGPMHIAHSDPFGMLSWATPGPPPTQLIVLPHVDMVAPPGVGHGHDQTSILTPNPKPAIAGDEFATLREYVPGDELRKVHWATSARRDTLMVRRDDQTRQARCTIVVDTRHAIHSEDSLDEAVSAAASIAAAATRRGNELRVVTTGGLDSLAGTGGAHLDQVLRELAMVQLDRVGSLASAFSGSSGLGADGTLVIVTSARADLGKLRSARAAQQGTVTVVCGSDTPGSDDDSDALFTDAPHSTGVRWNGRGHVTIPVSPTRGFAACWKDVMGAPMAPTQRSGIRG